MRVAFRELDVFSKVRDYYFANDEAFRLFQNVLIENPRIGVVIPGCGGVRKVRWTHSRRGKGKRGGLRLLYYFVEEAALILLMMVYDKNIDDIAPTQKKSLAAIAEAFRQEVAPHKEPKP